MEKPLLKGIPKKMKITLNSKFYRKKDIEETIKIFSELCDFKILNESYEMEFMPETGREAEIEGEFYNFLLGLSKANKKF